jgi:1-acyl-sn-glycerol-3-phosphate acyltransferase
MQDLAVSPGVAAEALERAPRRRPLRALYEWAVFYGLLALFGLSSLVWSLPAALLHRILPRRLGEPLGQFMMMAGFRYFVGAMRATGLIKCDLGALDLLRKSPSLVLAPNHPSLLDAVLVISRLPRVVGAAKAEIWDNPCLGGGARLAGFIRNDSPARLIRQAAQQLAAGRHFLIFPEGTRSAAAPVGEFKGGFALIARKAGVPVQTIFIESNSPFLGKGWPLLKKPAFPLVYRARLGRRFSVSEPVHEFVATLHDYYRQELRPDRG